LFYDRVAYASCSRDMPASMQAKKKARQFVAPKPPKEDGGDVQVSSKSELTLKTIQLRKH